MAYDGGIHYTYSMLFLLCLFGGYIANTFLLFPKYFIVEEETNTAGKINQFIHLIMSI